jgi:hypothetical protein
MVGASRGKTGALASLRATRGELWLFLLGGTLLAFAVNLVSDAVGNLLPSHGLALGVGLGCVLLGVVLLFLSRDRNRRASYEGWVLCDKPETEVPGVLTPVPRYKLADRVARQVTLFDRNTVEAADRWREKPRKLIQDATEALCLQALGEAYASKSRDGECMGATDSDATATREELRDVLKDNLLLDLLMDPDLFEVDTESVEAEYAALRVGSTLGFEPLKLRLPKEAKLARSGEKLMVKTSACTLTMRTRCTGSTASTPSAFKRHYLALPDSAGVAALEVSVDLRVRFSARSLCWPGALRDLGWIDEWLNLVEELVDAPSFYTRIGWEPATTLIEWLGERQGPGGETEGAEGLLRQTLDSLRSKEADIEPSSDPDLHRLRFGSSAVFIARGTGVDRGWIFLTAPVLQNVMDGEDRLSAVEYEVRAADAEIKAGPETKRGHFFYEQAADAILLRTEVHCSKTDPADLAALVREIGGTADDYDDRLQERLGSGRTAEEAAQAREAVRDPTARAPALKALRDARRNPHGKLATKRMRTADGSWVDVLLTDDLQPLKTELTALRDPQDSAPESSEALLVLTWEGPVPVKLDDAGCLAAGRDEIRGATRP